MALTPSNMIPLGTKAPEFSLPDVVSDTTLSLKDVAKAKGLVVMFICNHCPYVKHIDQGIAQIAQDYQDREIGFVAINANDVQNYPEDAPDKMKTFAATNGFTFPYLFDESQECAKAYDAACTPDIYLFDKDLKLVYRGQFDDSRPGNNSPVTGKDLREAIDCLLAGKPLPSNQIPSMGCNIKWRS